MRASYSFAFRPLDFEAMASEHERWILELFGGLDGKTVQQLHQTLGQLRVQMMQLDKNEDSKT